MSAPVLLHDWAGRDVAAVLDEFRVGAAVSMAMAACRVLLASYSQDNYSGEAFVLFEHDGRLFEVNASHCSCYGLEGQWEPEETTREALQHRLDQGTLGQSDYTGNVFASELRQVLASLGPT